MKQAPPRPKGYAKKPPQQTIQRNKKASSPGRRMARVGEKVAAKRASIIKKHPTGRVARTERAFKEMGEQIRKSRPTTRISPDDAF